MIASLHKPVFVSSKLTIGKFYLISLLATPLPSKLFLDYKTFWSCIIKITIFFLSWVFERPKDPIGDLNFRLIDPHMDELFQG